MDQHSLIPQSRHKLQSRKAAWAKLVSGLFLLILPYRCAIAEPQALAKPLATNSIPSNEKGVKIIGPFLSREDSDEYTRVVLKNGLTAVIFERRDVPLVAIIAYVKAGLQNESQSQKGVADRVMQGVCFGGTGSPGRRATQELSQIGGFMEGSCSTEYTQYSTVIHSTSFRKGMELEADALRNPDFSESRFLEENALSMLKSSEFLDSPKRYGLGKLNQLMFPLTPGLDSGIREDDQPSSLASGDLQKFYRQWYAPGNIILVICGSVERRQALDEIIKNYGDMVSTHTDSINFPPESSQTIIRYRQLRSEIKQALVFIGFQGPRPYTSDWYACQLLQAILAEGNSSKLNYELKRDQGLASSVAYQSLELRRQGGFSFSIATSTRNIEAVEAAVFIELEKIKNGQLEDTEIERAKKLVERRFYLDQEDLVAQARQLARFEDVARFSEWSAFVGKISSIRHDEVVQAAREFFLLRKANIVESLPVGLPLRDLTQPDLQRILETAVRAKVQDSQLVGTPEEKKTKTKKTSSKDIGLFYRKASGELTSAWVNHELTTYTVLHGPDVLVKQSQALPIISLGIFFSGGRIFENADNYGITELMLRASTRETLSFSPIQIVASIESHGVELQTMVDRDLFGFVLTGIKPNFEETLSIIASIINEPRFSATQLEIEKRQLFSEMAAVDDNMEELAQQLFYESLFAARPYGMPALGTFESMKKIRPSDVTDWHTRWVRTVRPIIVIAGDTDGSKIVSLLSAKLSLSGKNLVELPRQGELQQPEPFKENVRRELRHHSALVFGALTQSPTSQLLHSMTAARALLSGPGSGLVEGMRNAQVLPAIVDVSYEPGWVGSSFNIGVSTMPGMREKIREVVDTRLRTLQDKPIPDAECKRAIAMASTREIRHWQHRNAQVFDYARLKNFGLGLEELRNFLTHFQELERGDIQAAFKNIGPRCQVIAGIEGTP